MKDNIKKFFTYLMEKPEVNSRFVFLTQGLIHAIGVLVLTVAFIWAANKEAYPTMVLAVGGGGAAAAVGRYMTKKAGEKSDSEAASSTGEKDS